MGQLPARHDPDRRGRSEAASTTSADAASFFRVKASVFRAYLKWIERERLAAPILESAGGETVRLAQSPPLASTWLDGARIDELVAGIEAHRGLDGVQRAAEFVLRNQAGMLLEPVASAILPMIGTSPASIYSRWSDICRTVIDGQDAEWRSTSPGSGVLRIAYPRADEVPLRTFVCALPGVEHSLRLTNSPGTVSFPKPVTATAADFEIRWATRGSTGADR